MDKDQKKMSERILIHIFEIIRLLTGEVSFLQHLNNLLTMVEMKKDKMMTGKILNHSLEIIYLLTGEEYTIVKKSSPINGSIHQQTGECEDAAVPLSMEVWECTEGRMDTVVKNHKIFNTMRSADIKTENGEGEIEADGKDILKVTIQSDVCAGFSEDNLHTLRIIKKEDDEHDDDYIKQDKVIPYSCADGLSNRITTFQDLQEHRAQNQVADHSSTTAEKPHVCTKCGKGFSGRSNLIVHLRSHTEDMIHICQTCGKSFPKKFKLARHQKIHAEEKGFVCQTCGKGFSRKSSLVSHQRTHTGEKPYVCHICGKGFAQKTPFNIHIKIHTEVESYT